MTEVWYLTHPNRDDPERRFNEVLKVRKKVFELKGNEVSLLIPHLATMGWMFENGSGQGLDLCKNLLSKCDKVIHISDEISEGMKVEHEFAKEIGIPVEKIDIDVSNVELNFPIKKCFEKFNE